MKFQLENRSSELSMADLSSIVYQFSTNETLHLELEGIIPDNAVKMIFEMDRPINTEDEIYSITQELLQVSIYFCTDLNNCDVSYSGFKTFSGLDIRLDRLGNPFNQAIMEYSHYIPNNLGRYFKFSITSPTGLKYRLPRIYFEKV